MSLGHTIRNILGIVISPKFNALDKLSQLSLRPLTFVTPTVDGSSFLPLQNIGGDWGNHLASDPIIQPVKDAVDTLIVTAQEQIKDYNFENIQSISSGKSLMHGSASNYKDVLDWGSHMYSAKNIGFESDSEFNENITHVKNRFLNRDEELKLEIYGWHHGRNCVINSDGSHHAAALVRQIHAQGRSFQCKASIKKYYINENSLSPLYKDFYLFVADDNCDKEESTYYVSLALSELDIKIATLAFPRIGKSYRLFVIPKEQNSISSTDMQKWISSNIQSKRMIDFFEFTKNSAHVLDRHAVSYTEDNYLG